MNTWFVDHAISVLQWPTNSPKLNPTQEDVRHQTQQHRRTEGYHQSNLDIYHASVVPENNLLPKLLQ